MAALLEGALKTFLASNTFFKPDSRAHLASYPPARQPAWFLLPGLVLSEEPVEVFVSPGRSFVPFQRANGKISLSVRMQVYHAERLGFFISFLRRARTWCVFARCLAVALLRSLSLRVFRFLRGVLRPGYFLSSSAVIRWDVPPFPFFVCPSASPPVLFFSPSLTCDATLPFALAVIPSFLRRADRSFVPSHLTNQTTCG